MRSPLVNAVRVTSLDTSVAARGSRHESTLLALAARTSTGSERFRVDRSGDYFALGRQLADDDAGHVSFGAWQGDALVGTAAVAQQARIVDGAPTTVHYVHDLRVRPEARRRGVAAALLRAVGEAGGPNARFCATVLDDNTHAPQAFARAAIGREPHQLGQTLHVGLPLFGRTAVDASAELIEFDEDEFEHHRARLVAAEERVVGAPWRRIGGTYAGIAVGGRVVWVTRLAMETSRSFVRSGRSLALDALRVFSRAAACPPFPRRGDALAVAYVAYPSHRELSWAVAYRDLLVRRGNSPATYLFAGVPKGLPRTDTPFATLSFTSTTWGFFEGASTDIHELTRI